MVGTVLEFDEHAGFGTLQADDGRRFFFHCTRVTDGSRGAAAGAAVCFAVVPGHRGQWEAVDVEKQ